VHVLEHVNQSRVANVNAEIIRTLLQLTSPHAFKGLLGPLSEPVDRTAVDQRREHPQPRGESVTDRGHRHDDVHVTLHATQVQREDVHLIRLQLFLDALSLARIQDVFLIFLVVDVRHITRV
jgi:hypothetical protein